MKKRSILTVLIALFLVSLISCADSNSGGGNPDGGNGGGSGGDGGDNNDNVPSTEGIISFTPEEKKPNPILFHLGFYLRGTGKQKSLFNRCQRDMNQKDTLVMKCDELDTNHPSYEPDSLTITNNSGGPLTYKTNFKPSNYLLTCFDYDRAVPNTCKSSKIIQSGSASTKIYLGINYETPPPAYPSFGVNHVFTITKDVDKPQVDTYISEVNFLTSVTPECVGGSTLDPDIPNNYLCNDQSKGKFVIPKEDSANTVAAFSIWDFLTEGSKDGFIKNLEIKFADDFFTIFKISPRTTCKVVDNVVSIDNNCQVLIQKYNKGLTGKRILNITGTLSPDKVSQGTSIDAVYTFIAE